MWNTAPEPTDWAGNIIKAGDWIVSVRVKPLFSKLGIFVPGEGHRVTSELPEHIWEPGEANEVVEKDGILFCRVDRMDTAGTVYHFQLGGPFKDPSVITCIRGKSDSEEAYYQEYFKA